MRRNRRLLSACLAACLFCGAFCLYGGLPVYAEDGDATIENLEQQKKELDNKLQALDDDLDSVKAQKSAEQGKQKQLENEIVNVQEQISLYMAKIDLVDEAIATKEIEIAQKAAEVAESEEQFAKRVRAMYISNTSNSVLNTILSAKSFADMLNQTEIVKRVSEADQQLIATLTKQKEELAQLKSGLEEEKAELAAAQESCSAKNEDLNALLSQSEATESELVQIEKQYMANKEKYAKEIAAIEAEIDRVIALNAGKDAMGDGVLMWPLPNNKRISSPFGWRILFGKQDFHTGIDIPASKGTAIQVADTGEVILTQKSSTGYGWHVVVDHGGGYVTLYAHASAIYVGTGDIVQKGQSIAGVGSTGNSTGNHLHFEVRVNSVQNNPLNYVRQPS